MVLTEEQQQDVYPATTLENVSYNGGQAVNTESLYYSIDATKIANQSTATSIPVYQNNNGNPPYNNNPYSNTTANSARLYQLNATTNTNANKNGLGIVLKVMSGDNLNIFGKSYHKRPSGSGYTGTTNNIILTELINAFAGSGIVTSKGVTGSQITGQSGFPANMDGLIGTQPVQSGGRPKAAINWILLDEQFKYVTGGFDMVGDAGSNTAGTLKSHSIVGLAIPKNGYIYIYCSNESRYNVFFDNLQVIHNRGPILEETHYYPFGLAMQGISSKAAGSLTNKYKYNGIEHNTDFDMNMYDAFYRNLDPQIGRFWQIDPKLESAEAWSPYSAMLDNPVRYADPLGDSTIKPVASNRPIVVPNQPKKESTPFISFTLVITEGTYGVHGKVLDVGIESVGMADEKDIIGVRDNKPVVDGHTNGEAETTTREGYSGSVGGFGGSDITETKKLNGSTMDRKRSETFTTPVVSSTKETDKDGKVTSTSSTQVFGVKAGLHYGVEIGLQINWKSTNGFANVPRTYNDNLVPVRIVMPVKKK